MRVPSLGPAAFLSELSGVRPRANADLTQITGFFNDEKNHFFEHLRTYSVFSFDMHHRYAAALQA